jgi:uncharacterized protein involved in response to NO
MPLNGSVLFAAPHRLAFLSGSLGLAAIALWWAVRLGAMHLGWPEPDPGNLPTALLHAPVLLLHVYPAFIFGFLLTVFPRWMGQPDLEPHRFGPVAAGIAAAMAVTVAGLWTGSDGLILIGFAIFAAAWALGLINMAAVVRANSQSGKPPCWHAISALTALLIGLGSLLLVCAFLIARDPRLLRWGNLLALNGFILPVFLTVAHRMVPFFAGSVVQDYQRWRPDWLLAVLWVLLSLRVGGELALLPLLSGAAAFALAVCTGLMAWRWWPRSPAPGLLRVLIWGFAWAPAGFALAALASFGLPLGLAPTHALALGFAASLLVAMVTRVTLGHSGRPLAMVPLAWLALGTVQMAAVVRIFAALRGEQPTMLVIAAILFAAGILPWLMHNALIYLRPRRDGRSG